jgi:hypothetical protein
MLVIAREMNLTETAFVLHGVLVLDAPSLGGYRYLSC